jgi:hypothetical protein
MILFARFQRHARCRVQGIIGVLACVLILAKDDDKSLKANPALRAVPRNPDAIPKHRRDAYATFRSTSQTAN